MFTTILAFLVIDLFVIIPESFLLSLNNQKDFERDRSSNLIFKIEIEDANDRSISQDDIGKSTFCLLIDGRYCKCYQSSILNTAVNLPDACGETDANRNFFYLSVEISFFDTSNELERKILSLPIVINNDMDMKRTSKSCGSYNNDLISLVLPITINDISRSGQLIRQIINTHNCKCNCKYT